MNHSDVRLPQKLAPQGYEPLELLYEGRYSLVYRALRSADQTAVIIKTTPPQVVLRASDHLAFRNQFTIGQNLNHPGILQILGLEPCNQSYALIMEDVQGIALSQFLQAAVSLKDGLTIALQLAEILHYLSQERILHKDIKPANILIHPQTLQVKLIDFGLASRLPKETQTIKNPKDLEGTLAYMAPEQTGRMNRGIDFRSDFYSLGVTLFELFAGQLPFQADEPMGWLHCHIAQMPPSLTEFGVPEAVANIIAKLLAKNAEDRYQSALGLKHDLEQCLTQLRERGEIEPFELGQEDRCDRILIPEKLYGREADVQILLDAFERVVQGASELVLVAGYSGVGKTAVVNEVHKPILQQEGYFIQGKFDQFNRNIPLSAFVQAFSSLVQQLLSESDADLTQWKAAILTALGNNAQVVIEVIPSLEIILGKQPKAPELSVSAAQNRFNLVFNQFIRVFTQQEHPLVIFLDDLQWADSASLGLLKLLMSDSVNNNHSLLVVGAYRDNEVCLAHPLMVCLTEIELEQSSINTIHLDPLSKANINKLVSDSLLCSEVVARPLSELIYQKTQGNPFFTIQFLQGLYEDNYIAFDREEKCWQCDLSQLKKAALSDDLLAYMATRLHKLPETTQDVLKFAACMGSRFDVATLVVVCEKSELAITDDLWSALQVGLIVPETQIYRLSPEDEVANSSEESSIEYRFLHDRVQQAAYTLIPQSEKAKTHYQIGKSLNQDSSPENIKTNIFDIVNQLNLGQSLVSLQSERNHLAQLNLIAGTKAKNSIAYQASFEYAQTGLFLLGDKSWSRQYQLTLNLHNLATESAYLKGDFSVLESLVNTINQNTKTILDRVLAVQTQIQFYATQQNYSSAISTGREILQELGIYFPDRPSFEQVKQEYNGFQPYINQFSIQQIEELPLLKDREKLAAAKILLALAASAVISDTNLCWLIILKLVKLSLEHGNSPYSAHCYAIYGILVNLIEQDIEKYYQFGQLSLHIVDIFPQSPTKSSIFQIVGSYTSYLKSHFREARPLLSAAYVNGLESGDFEYGGYSVSSECQNFFFSGEPLTTVHTKITQGDQALEQLNNQFSLGLNRFLKQLVAKLTGQLEQPNSLASDCFSLKEINESLTAAKDRFSLHHGYLYEATLQYLFLNTNLALANIQESAKNLDSVSGWLTEYIHYFYESLIYLDYINFANASEENLVNQYLSKIENNQKKYQVWADHAPMNFQHKFDLVEAEKHRVLGNKFAALELYDKAIAGAKENQFIQEEALANERAAKFYLDWGKDKIAAVYMQEAYFCYERWGAKAKTNDLEQRYPQLLQPIPQAKVPLINPLETLARVGTPQTSHVSQGSYCSTDVFNQTFDFAAILKAAQALTETIQLDEFLHNLSQIILQNSGADQLIVVLPKSSDQWQVRTIATTEAIHLYADSLDDHPNVPGKLIQYVRHTREPVSTDSLQLDLPLGDYWLESSPQSFLCAPLIVQDELLGILYLHSPTTRGLFSDDRLITLNFLFSQVAIGLKNAQVFEEELALKSKVIESSVDGIAIAEANQLIYLNQVHADLFGYDTEELLGQSWEILYSPAEAQKIKAIAFPQVMESGQWRGETTALRKDGSTFDQEISLFNLDDGRLICICRDISDRKAAELALQDAQAQFRRMTENVPGMIYRWVIRADGSQAFIYVSSKVREFFELEPDVVLENETLIWQRIHPDDASRLQNDIALHTKILQPFKAELRLILPQKGRRWVQLNSQPEPLDNGDVVWDGVMIDISDRKLAEQQFQMLSERLELAVDSAQLGIWEWDHQENTLAWDDQMFVLYGVSPHTFEGTYQDWANCIHPEDLAQLEADTPNIINSKANRYTQEFRILRPDGSLRYILATASLERNSQGQPIRSVGINLDISDRKQAEAQLQHTNEKLIRATQHKSEFLASMSHELRTPLNAVLGFSQLMQRDCSISAEHHDMLATINRNGEYLLALINDILEMSKIEAGKITLNPKQVDLPRFLDDIRETFKVKAEAKHLVFKVTHTSDIPRYIEADEVKLRQILLNLLSNALKFTREGQISLHTQVLDRGLSLETIHLQFTVSDTGPGIVSEDLDSIFQAFIQSASGKQHQQGTGLGLPISRKFAQMMGGNIQVTSTIGKGSQFNCDIYAQILATDTEVGEMQPHRYHNIQGVKPQHPTYRLLIVDDNPDNRAVLLKMLSIPGLEVRDAVDGLQAVELNESWQPHLICMDINMPQMNGLVATQQIRQSGWIPKIIAITANAFSDDHQAALAAGCDDFLAKPFTEARVFECIACLLKVEFTTAPLPFSPAQPVESVGQNALIKEGIEMMPVAWQTHLQQALRTLDQCAIQQLLLDVPTDQVEMVAAISKLLKDYRYDILMHILEIEP